MAVSLLLEREVPLYSIKCYENYLFRVTKRLCRPATSLRIDSSEWEHSDSKLDNALCRSRTAVREYALCNRWDFFVTLTIDGSKYDRYDLKAFMKEFCQWLQNLKKTKYPQLRYLLVPEKHKKNDPLHGRAWHLHGMISGIPLSPMPSSAPKRFRETGYGIWKDYWDRYGMCTVCPVKDNIAVGFYVSKYITKTCAEMAALKGVHTYYHSRGLGKALPFGDLYHGNLYLDGLLKNKNRFYASGFFKCEDMYGLAELCDEVSVMYRSYVFTDPATDEVLAVMGGDDEDEYIQEVLDLFTSSGYAVEVTPSE